MNQSSSGNLAPLTPLPNTSLTQKRTYDEIASETNHENQDPDAFFKESQEKRVRWADLPSASSPDAVQAKFEPTGATINNYESQLFKKNAKIEELEALLEAAQSRERKYYETIQHNKTIGLERSKKAKQSGGTIQRLQRQLSDKRSVLTQKEELLRQKGQTIRSLESRLNDRKETVQRLEKQIQELEALGWCKDRKKLSLTARENSVMNENIQLLHDLRHVEDDLQLQKERNDFLEGENVQLRRDRFEAHREIHHLEQRSGILFSRDCYDSWRPGH
ncbi:MAG: hypothetical protein Q9227_006015 [Pyrenula ochraceoflavens]